MEPNNPYASPKGALVEEQSSGTKLQGWSPAYLRTLAWLCLASLLGTLAILALTFTVDKEEQVNLGRAMDALGIAVVIMGCYLLLRLKHFAEQRFAARWLSLPVWLVIALSLMLEMLDIVWGEAIFSTFDVITVVYVGVLILLGGATSWLGICLLRVQNVYPIFRVMAWMEVIGGAMLATVLLVLVAIIPLLGGTLTMMLVFFRAAAEVQTAN
ncbi:hypothetical protein [Pseudomonas sp. Marseille-Q8238]